MLPPVCRPFLVDVGVTDERTRGAPAGRPATLGEGEMGVPSMPGAGTRLTHDRHRRPRRSPSAADAIAEAGPPRSPTAGAVLFL